jgi:hypothetical protein
MRSERGQASVEWIGLVVLVALGLTALARFAPRADAGELGTELLHTIGCAARAGCEGAGGATPAGSRSESSPGSSAPRRLVTLPPLVPVAPGERRARAPRSRPLAAPLVRGRALLPRAGRGAGVLWRRSWMLCLGYERARYAVLHPEIRFPRQTIPISEDLRIANDCLSPVDLVRDYDLIRGRP